MTDREHDAMMAEMKQHDAGHPGELPKGDAGSPIARFRGTGMEGHMGKILKQAEKALPLGDYGENPEENRRHGIAAKFFGRDHRPGTGADDNLPSLHVESQTSRNTRKLPGLR